MLGRSSGETTYATRSLNDRVFANWPRQFGLSVPATCWCRRPCCDVPRTLAAEVHEAEYGVIPEDDPDDPTRAFVLQMLGAVAQLDTQ